MNEERFRRAIAAIDAANADDPNRITVRGVTRQKELAHAELVTEWVRRLRPDASEALLLAARAHHVHRWTIPRSSYPNGRSGYLQWRRDLHEFHVPEAARILAAESYDQSTLSRVGEIIRKKSLGSIPKARRLRTPSASSFWRPSSVTLRRGSMPPGWWTCSARRCAR